MREAGRGGIRKEGMWLCKAIVEGRHPGVGVGGQGQKSLCKGSEVGTSSQVGMIMNRSDTGKGSWLPPLSSAIVLSLSYSQGYGDKSFVLRYMSDKA